MIDLYFVVSLLFDLFSLFCTIDISHLFHQLYMTFHVIEKGVLFKIFDFFFAVSLVEKRKIYKILLYYSRKALDRKAAHKYDENKLRPKRL